MGGLDERDTASSTAGIDTAAEHRAGLAGEDPSGAAGAGVGASIASGQAGELPDSVELPAALSAPQSPLFAAQQALRYDRQVLIREYERLFGCRLIVVIDPIFAHGPTLLEELLHDTNQARDLHVMLASPGGDGEVAVRMVRLMQARCRELTIIVPDQAKSAATILSLGADHILMGPSSDLGPIDPQFQFADGRLVGAKEIIQAVKHAEERISAVPQSFPMYSSLLSDINAVMVQQAEAALARCVDQLRDVLRCTAGRSEQDVERLVAALKLPLVDNPNSHGATFGADDAELAGLPVLRADLDSVQWRLIWTLWTRYFGIGCWPSFPMRSVYEGAKASQVFGGQQQ